MSYMYGHVDAPSGTVARLGQVLGVRRRRFHATRVMSPSLGTTMKKKYIQHERSRRNWVNTQLCNQRTRTEFSSSHVGRAMNAYEQVWNGKPSIQEGKEAVGHSTGQQ